MPNPRGEIPKTKRGDAITADFLNRIASAARRAEMLPGSFQSSAIAVQAPLPRSAAAAGGDVLVVLIDDDILGVVEDDPATELVVTEGPEGSEEEITHQLWGYERRELTLKRFRLAVDGDPGYVEDVPKMILATEEVEELDDPEDPEGPTHTHTQYVTQVVYYDEGDDFLVGSYGREDYPDYEEEDWPPLLEGGPEQIDADEFKRRYRGYATKDADGNWLIDPIFCKELPPPTLASLGYEAPGT